ncbi:hypothetical protein WMY93_008285 [Mugilogobius chulae]|uniref:StAR-related lipid transfer protein 13 n=1 Tax=Mugilogobius chulae TaxID=88201 RepID=A0AAW0PJ29_9GOBI
MASLSASYQPPRELPHYNTLPIKRHSQGGGAKPRNFEEDGTYADVGPSTRRKSANRRAPLVISGPVLQGEEPRALQVLQCTPISQLENGNKLNHQNNDSSGSVSPVSNYKEVSPVDRPNVETVLPVLNENCPKPRTANKRSSKYLEDMELPSQGKRTECGPAQFGKNQFHSYENLLIHIPKDHKPGTFPKALSIESLAPASGDTSPQTDIPKNGLSEHWAGKPLSKPCPGAPRGSRVSVYDNVPGSHLYASTGDLLDLEKEDNLFPHLDDIIQHVSGLQQIVDHWSRSVLPEGDMGRRRGRTGPPERRGQGRSPSSSLHISSQSAGQLSLLQKFSLLRLTAIMEKYSMSNKHGWTWSVPKFMKRMKMPDYKEKSVFGVPLIVHVQRCGFPLPLCLQQALSHLKTHCLDQVGLFRKSGVKSRIQALRQQCELSPDFVSYEDQSAYDVADMVKQFFRDLPEPLLTSKLGETFLHIYQYVPKEQRLQAVRAAILLMPDENREVLQTLLFFLRDVTSVVEENQMTPMNLAVCLGPSLFHLSLLKNETLSPSLTLIILVPEVGDGNPLRRWRISLEVSAAPSEVLQRLLKERPLWQVDLLQEKVLETLDKQTDVYQYSCRNMTPQSSSDYVVLRSWRTDLSKGSCALVCVSVDHEDSPRTGAVRGVVLESQYLLEPSGTGRTRLTHICRMDLRGRSPEWYNKAFGHLLVNEAQRVRSSFQTSDSAHSPEAKL